MADVVVYPKCLTPIFTTKTGGLRVQCEDNGEADTHSPELEGTTRRKNDQESSLLVITSYNVLSLYIQTLNDQACVVNGRWSWSATTIGIAQLCYCYLIIS